MEYRRVAQQQALTSEFHKKTHSRNKRQFTVSLVLNISEAKENTFDSFITYTFSRDKSKKANGTLEKQ